jgi:hypothetical protein
MSTGVIPEGEDPEDIEVKSVEWLKRNAGSVDIHAVRGTDSEAWTRGRPAADTAAIDSPDEPGAAIVRLPDGDPHSTLLVESAGDKQSHGPWAGACDCKGWQFHDGPCAHLVCRAVMSIQGDGHVPVDVQLYQELANAGGPEPDADPDDAMSDIDGLKGDGEERADQEAATDGAGDEDVVDADAAGQSVRGPEAGDQHPPDEIVDVPVDQEDVSMPHTTGDPFASELSENVPERFVMDLGDEPYIRRAGYAAIARNANLRVTVDPVTPAEETGFEHARYKAVVRDADGDVVGEDFGTAHLDGEDLTGAEYQLDELASTRAIRRALEWATGAGATLRRGDGA